MGLGLSSNRGYAGNGWYSCNKEKGVILVGCVAQRYNVGL